MSVTFRDFEGQDADRWDSFVGRAANGTLLHSRAFLGYHRARFRDASLICEDGRGRIIAVIPAAADAAEPARVISHPGATFGGLVSAALAPGRIGDLFDALFAAYRERGFERLHYKTVPSHLIAQPADADRHALWRRGARLVGSDLWAIVNAAGERRLGTNHRRNIKSATESGLTVARRRDDDAYRAFHDMLAANLADRHGISPAHSLAELLDLRDRLSDRVSLWLAEASDTAAGPLAGAWVFHYGQASWHTQYIAAAPAGRATGAVHFLIESLIGEAARAGASTLSLGACTERDGAVVNHGLARFKMGFGGGFVVHDSFEADLLNAGSG